MVPDSSVPKSVEPPRGEHLARSRPHDHEFPLRVADSCAVTFFGLHSPHNHESDGMKELLMACFSLQT